MRGRIVALVCGLCACEGSTLPPPLPTLSVSRPAAGETVVRTSWIDLELSEDVPAGAEGWIQLTCADAPQAIDVDRVSATRLVINPRGELPAGVSCTAQWESVDGNVELSFSTAPVGFPANALCDRDDPTLIAPFPDDVFLTDADTPTGHGLDIALPDRSTGALIILGALTQAVKHLDGFSPAGPIVVSLDAPLDPTSLPRTLEASVDPLSSVALIDVKRSSPNYGERVPIHVLPRSEVNTDGTIDNNLVVFSGPLLDAYGQYALVVTRRAFADVTAPLSPSPFLQRAMANEPTTEAEGEVAEILAPVMGTLSRDVRPPIRRDDIAMVQRISIRSDVGITDDLISVRQQLDAHTPSFNVRSVQAHPDPDVAAIVHGTWRAPQFRDGDYFARDADGKPLFTRYEDVPFVLTLPTAALDGSVPITMYQHGTPGSAESEVPFEGRGGLGTQGFAVIGFTDIPNREVIQNGPADELGVYLFSSIVFNQQVPEMNLTLNTAEQLAFLRVIQAMGGLDVLPIGAPDGVPEIDASAITYLGISQGSERGVNLLPYAPEIRAAALVVDGGRMSSLLLHASTQTLYEGASEQLEGIRYADLYVAVALFQMGGDNADPVMHARYLYNGAIDYGLNGARPSVLMTEGLQDSMIPPWSTQAAAAEMGLPHLAPRESSVPYLEPIDEAVSGNIAPDITAAFAQFVPKGVEGVPETPGCEFEFEGHFCPQSAPVALAQRAAFFLSALEGTPVIAPSH